MCETNEPTCELPRSYQVPRYCLLLRLPSKQTSVPVRGSGICAGSVAGLTAARGACFPIYARSRGFVAQRRCRASTESYRIAGGLWPKLPVPICLGWSGADSFLLADGMTDLVPCFNVEDYAFASCQFCLEATVRRPET